MFLFAWACHRDPCTIDVRSDDAQVSWNLSPETGAEPPDRLVAVIGWYGGGAQLTIPLDPGQRSGHIALLPHDNSASSAIQQRALDLDGELRMDVRLEASRAGESQCTATLDGGARFPALRSPTADSALQIPQTNTTFDQQVITNGIAEVAFGEALDLQVQNWASSAGVVDHQVFLRATLLGDILLPLLDSDAECGFDNDGQLPLNSAFLAGGHIYVVSESTIGVSNPVVCKFDLEGAPLAAMDTGDWPVSVASQWMHNRVFAGTTVDHSETLTIHTLGWQQCEDCDSGYSSTSLRFELDAQSLVPADAEPAFFDSAEIVSARDSLYGNSASSYGGFRADSYPIGSAQQEDAFILVSSLDGEPLFLFVNEAGDPLLPGALDTYPGLEVVELPRLQSGQLAVDYPHDAVFYEDGTGGFGLVVLSLHIGTGSSTASFYRVAVGSDSGLEADLACTFDTGSGGLRKSSLIPLPADSPPELVGVQVGAYPGNLYWLATGDVSPAGACRVVAARTVDQGPSSHAWTEVVSPSELVGGSGIGAPVTMDYDFEALAPYLETFDAPWVP